MKDNGFFFIQILGFGLIFFQTEQLILLELSSRKAFGNSLNAYSLAHKDKMCIKITSSAYRRYTIVGFLLPLGGHCTVGLTELFS